MPGLEEGHCGARESGMGRSYRKVGPYPHTSRITASASSPCQGTGLLASHSCAHAGAMTLAYVLQCVLSESSAFLLTSRSSGSPATTLCSACCPHWVSEVDGIPAAQSWGLVALLTSSWARVPSLHRWHVVVDFDVASVSPREGLCGLPRPSLSAACPQAERWSTDVGTFSCPSLRPGTSSAPSPRPCVYFTCSSSPIPRALSCPATALPLAQLSSVPPTPTMLASSCPTGVLLSASLLCLSPSPFYSPDPREASSHIRDLSRLPLPFHRPQLGPVWRQASCVGRYQAGGTRSTRGSPRDPGIGDAWRRWTQEVSGELLLPWDGGAKLWSSSPWQVLSPYS